MAWSCILLPLCVAPITDATKAVFDLYSKENETTEKTYEYIHKSVCIVVVYYIVVITKTASP